VICGILGVAAALLGGYHGVGEVLQGETVPRGIFINAWGGPACRIEAGQNCAPAITMLPTTFVRIGVVTIVTSAATLASTLLILMGRSRGAPLFASSVLLLLVGGGGIAPILGLAGAAVGRSARSGKVGGDIHRGVVEPPV